MSLLSSDHMLSDLEFAEFGELVEENGHADILTLAQEGELRCLLGSIHVHSYG